MRFLEVYGVSQLVLALCDVQVENILVVSKNLLEDTVGERHHESVLINQHNWLLSSGCAYIAFEGTHVRIKSEFDIEGALEGLVKDRVCHLLGYEQLRIEAIKDLFVDC